MSAKWTPELIRDAVENKQRVRYIWYPEYRQGWVGTVTSRSGRGLNVTWDKKVGSVFPETEYVSLDKYLEPILDEPEKDSDIDLLVDELFLIMVNDGNYYKSVCRREPRNDRDLPPITLCREAYNLFDKINNLPARNDIRKALKKELWNHYKEEFGNKPSLCNETPQPEQQPKETISMNTLTAYKDTPSIKVVLIHGKPSQDYTEEELVSLIRAAKADQEAIKDLIGESSRMKKKFDGLSSNIAVYVGVLDKLKD